MRILWTVVWAFLLSFMAAYVIGNMAGTGFHFTQVVVMTVLFSLTAIVLGDGLIEEEA